MLGAQPLIAAARAARAGLADSRPHPHLVGVCRASDPVRLFVLSVCFSGHFEAAPNYLERSRCLEPPQVVRPSSYPEPAQEQDVHSIRSRRTELGPIRLYLAFTRHPTPTFPATVKHGWHGGTLRSWRWGIRAAQRSAVSLLVNGTPP